MDPKPMVKKPGCPEGKGWKRWRFGGTTKLFDPNTTVSKLSTGEQALEAVNDALDPRRVPTKVKTLADMSEDEVRELEKKLGAPLSPNAKRKR